MYEGGEVGDDDDDMNFFCWLERKAALYYYTELGGKVSFGGSINRQK